MDAASLTLDGFGGVVHFVLGLLVWLLPGIAAADRWMPRHVRRSARQIPLSGDPRPGSFLHLAWAPIWSVTILVLVASLLDFAFGVPLNAPATWFLSLLSALWIARRRGRAVFAWIRTPPAQRPPPFWRREVGSSVEWGREADSLDTAQVGTPVRQSSRRTFSWSTATTALTVLCLVASIGLVVVSQYILHTPAQDANGRYGPNNLPANQGDDSTYGHLFAVVGTLLSGHDDPYPLHADEHWHMAQIAQVQREATVDIHDPLSGAAATTSLFSVAGFLKERGFHVAFAQFGSITGASVATLARFAPSLWAGYLAFTLWLTLRPAPGATAAVALLAILHTTPRFMGVAFLVPSAFGLPWILAVATVVLRQRGPPRLAGIWLLMSAAFAIHLVVGTLCLAAGLVAAILQGATVRDRLATAAVVALPMAWILPANWADVLAQIRADGVLPFNPLFFTVPGLPVYALAALGAGAAWYRPEARLDETRSPHRVLFVLAVAMAVSMATSIAFDHRNDATYTRQAHFFFVCVAALASLALGLGARWLGRVIGAFVDARSARPAADAAALARDEGAVVSIVGAGAAPSRSPRRAPGGFAHDDTRGRTSRGDGSARERGEDMRAAAAALGGRASDLDAPRSDASRSANADDPAPGTRRNARWRDPPEPATGSGRAASLGVAFVVTGLVLSFVLAAPLRAHMEEPMYRVFDGKAWDKAEALATYGAVADRQDFPPSSETRAARDVRANATFLSDPAVASVYGAVSGLRPWTYTTPGSLAVRGADVGAYVQSGGANATWLAQRDIRIVALDMAPHAVNTTIGPSVYLVPPK